jgi:hypothetical protein
LNLLIERAKNLRVDLNVPRPDEIAIHSDSRDAAFA